MPNALKNIKICKILTKNRNNLPVFSSSFFIGTAMLLKKRKLVDLKLCCKMKLGFCRFGQ